MSKLCEKYDADESGERLPDERQNGEEKFLSSDGERADGTPEKGVGRADETPENAEEKISAEWQGASCRYDYGGVSPKSADETGTGTFFSAEGAYGVGWREEMDRRSRDRTKEQNRREKDARRLRALKRRKVLFALSFVGLLLDFVCGIGFLICLPVAVVASVDLRRLFAEEKKTSSQLVWAATIGYIGGLLGLIFFILML